MIVILLLLLSYSSTDRGGLPGPGSSSIYPMPANPVQTSHPIPIPIPRIPRETPEQQKGWQGACLDVCY